MDKRMERLKPLLDGLDTAGAWFGLLALRLVLAKEFWNAGQAKLNGQNGLFDIQAQLPFLFSMLPPSFSWQLAAGCELLGALALLLGLGTRLSALALSILTLVAIAAMHAGHGYTISGWKLPLIYLAMLLPLILSGPGKLSIDHWLRRHFLRGQRRLWS